MKTQAASHKPQENRSRSGTENRTLFTTQPLAQPHLRKIVQKDDSLASLRLLVLNRRENIIAAKINIVETSRVSIPGLKALLTRLPSWPE